MYRLPKVTLLIGDPKGVVEIRIIVVVFQTSEGVQFSPAAVSLMLLITLELLKPQ